MLNLTRLILLTTAVFVSNTVTATSNTERLEQQALEYLSLHYNKINPEARIEIAINPINRHVKLKSCQDKIRLTPPKGNGNRVTLRAKCQVPLWQIFISAQVKQYADVVISKKSLPKKKQLTRDDLDITQVDITNLRSAYFQDKADILQWSTKRNIAQGSIITANMLKPPIAVKKGYSVVIEAVRRRVKIKATGTALEEGEIGEQIRVKNDRSGKIVKARVIKAGLVRVP